MYDKKEKKRKKRKKRKKEKKKEKEKVITHIYSMFLNWTCIDHRWLFFEFYLILRVHM